MRKYLVRAAVGAAALALWHGPAKAAYMDVPLPSNAYISQNGLDWAWAFPLPANAGVDLSYQATQGWRLPTAAELFLAPLATAFMFSGANVPLDGTDPVSGASFQATNGDLTGAAACATPYFSNGYQHCDWQDGLGQPYGPWAGMLGAPDFGDQLVVRASPVAVPEPASLALFGAGLLGLGLARRRRRAS